MPSRPQEGPFFVLRHLPRWVLAEGVCQLANGLPARFAQPLWRLALWLNGNHEVAAINRAMSLAESNALGAWDAFERCLRQLENPHGISASDLYLSRWPGRLARQLVARWLWGPAGVARPLDAVHDGHDAVLQGALKDLARRHVDLALSADLLQRARRAFEPWCSLAGDGPEPGALAAVAPARWLGLELAWRDPLGPSSEDLQTLGELLEQGALASPLDCLRWGQRCIDGDHWDLADACFGHARRLLPEEPGTWSGSAQVARAEGDPSTARRFWRRVLSRDPQDIEAWLSERALAGEDAHAEVPGTLRLDVPIRLTLGAETTLTAYLDGIDNPKDFVLHLLAPTGWGLEATPSSVSFDAQGRTETRLLARRPHRVLGEPWPLVALAVGPDGHLLARASVAVDDPHPGRLLLTVTEDHEIHEERGLFSPDLIERVLVDKSQAAADQGVPWTHMVEVGSVLAMTRAAAPRGDAWRRLWTAVRRHLVDEVARGHDVQPHLHTFNDPAYGHFPYTLEDDGWRPSLPFLLTEAQRRGDFSTVTPPPGVADDVAGIHDRLQAVEGAVAQLESVGRLGSSDYRALLWRSGLLEYGEGAADEAWSAVALRRAGLVAGSDVLVSGETASSTAFPCGWTQPGCQDVHGPLLQLPIVANLEGSYLQGTRRLRKLARRCLDAVRARPGVHLFTLLTHDKFINARRGRDEFQHDPAYGDWPLIRHHLDAWQSWGAELVTATEGVQWALDDLSLHLQAVLREETFLTPPGTTPSDTTSTKDPIAVRYRVQWLGPRHGVDEASPRQVWVPLPCSWRGRIDGITARQGDHPLEVQGADRHGFWIEVTSLEDVFVQLALAPAEGLAVPRLESVGPLLKAAASGDAAEGSEGGARHFVWACDEPFRAARVLIPWGDALPEGAWSCRPVGDTTDTSQAPICHAEASGLLLTGLAFEDDDLGNVQPAQWLLVKDPP